MASSGPEVVGERAGRDRSHVADAEGDQNAPERAGLRLADVLDET